MKRKLNTTEILQIYTAIRDMEKHPETKPVKGRMRGTDTYVEQ